MKLIERKHYLNTLISLVGTPDIKVITGIRRCGKSFLLQDFVDYIHKTNSEANIISINLLDLDYSRLKQYQNLHDYCMEKCKNINQRCNS